MIGFAGPRGLCVLAIIFLLFFVGWLWFFDGFTKQNVIVEIPRGAGLFGVARSLEQSGVIRKSEVFCLLVLLRADQEKLKYGEYRFPSGTTSYSAYSKLLRGEVRLRKVTFPEGTTLLQMAEILESAEIISGEAFLKFARDAEYASAKLGVDVPSLEGFLFPDTYFFARELPPEKVIRSMLARFKEIYSAIGAEDSELGIKDIVTTASLIEKETAYSPEKPVVSSVIRNRLERGMRLEFDPTVIYALGEMFSGGLKRKDMRFSSPYNTYLVSGLPPGPIAAPGLESLHAAVNPADTDYLYFVSTGDGRHIFSKTYREHRKAVKKVSVKKQTTVFPSSVK